MENSKQIISTEGSRPVTRAQEGAPRQVERHDLSGRLITLMAPNSVAAEDYRTLRTSLLYTSVDRPPKVVVLTSPGRREGKSTTCANLAVVMSQAGKHTLVIDCDLRRPSMHTIFGLRNLSGVVNILGDERALDDVCHEPLPGLKVITVGPAPHSPAELLSSLRFATFLDEARQRFDYVLIDAPPIGAVSDPAILASQADGTVLVLDAQKTRRGALRKAKRDLEAVGAYVLGTVMNRAKGLNGSHSPYTY